MCDFFWLSPADQGDLSDVVRASLQPPPPPPPPHHHRLPPAATPAAPTACSLLDSHHLQARANFDGDDRDEARSQRQRQLVNGSGSMGLMLGTNSSGGCACDHAAARCPQHHPEAEGQIPHQPPMSGPQPQRPQLRASGSSFVERDDDAPVLEEHVLDMATIMMAPHHPHASAIKRRKSQTKKVVCIPAPVAAPPGVGGRPSTSGEVVPSDLWAWRKYGQKPIKGSPYPRGYYRCSSSKGCSARKQVERSRADPSMLVITYTSDHNHPWPTQRNALAGSTRPAFSSSSAASRSHQHQHQHHSHSAAAVADTWTPAHRHASNDDVAVADNATPGSSIISASVHHHQLLKQEVVDDMDSPSKQPADHDCLLGMFADMDGALDVLGASDLHPKKQQQQATAQHLEKLPEEEDRDTQLLLGPDPFSFSFLDWVGASFGLGETAADNGGHSY